ncbi:hypothetical protein C8R47DRAFT_1324136 [Mycena vitilis]|nr:hypothetical protein C8R47DRAFT_1324136 [Mycena vitilis]
MHLEPPGPVPTPSSSLISHSTSHDHGRIPRPNTFIQTHRHAAPRKPVTLPPALLTATFRGREAAQRYLADFVIKELQRRAPAPNCMHLEEAPPSRMCRESFYFIMLNILRSVSGIACGRDADPLFTLVQAMEMLSRTDFSDGSRQCGPRCVIPARSTSRTAVRAREEVWMLFNVADVVRDGYGGGDGGAGRGGAAAWKGYYRSVTGRPILHPFSFLLSAVDLSYPPGYSSKEPHSFGAHC